MIANPHVAHLPAGGYFEASVSSPRFPPAGAFPHPVAIYRAPAVRQAGVGYWGRNSERNPAPGLLELTFLCVCGWGACITAGVAVGTGTDSGHRSMSPTLTDAGKEGRNGACRGGWCHFLQGRRGHSAAEAWERKE